MKLTRIYSEKIPVLCHCCEKGHFNSIEIEIDERTICLCDNCVNRLIDRLKVLSKLK